MKTLVIGDIHGCFREFKELLAAAGIADGDRIIALGDIVDRGPDTPKVLGFFRQGGERATTLMGNHERKHVRSFRNEIEPALSQVISRKQIGELYPAMVQWMSSLPLYLELPEAILVHGFFEPGVPLAAQRDTVVCGTMSGDTYLKRRFPRPWYELYDGAKPLIAGHEMHQVNGKPLVHEDRVYLIDTGCVRGHRLTGVLLPGFEVVSVPSHENYWMQVKEEDRDEEDGSAIVRLRGRPPADPGVPWEQADESILGGIIEAAKAQNARVLSQLRSDPQFDALKSRDQSERYDRLVRSDLCAPLLHLERRGELNASAARRVLKNPRNARKIAGILKLPIPADPAAPDPLG